MGRSPITAASRLVLLVGITIGLGPILLKSNLDLSLTFIYVTKDGIKSLRSNIFLCLWVTFISDLPNKDFESLRIRVSSVNLLMQFAVMYVMYFSSLLAALVSQA